jgi:Spy/CpxP family protein refolding chaperone
MRLTWRTGLLIFSLALNAAVIGAVGYNHFSQPAPGFALPCAIGDGHLYQRLGLTDFQLQQIQPLAHDFHSHIAELKSSMESKKVRLLHLLHRENDPEKLKELQTEMAATQQTIQNTVIAHITEIKKVLDPNQQEQFFALMAQTMNCGTALAPASGGIR